MSAATQHLALSAILFLYREFLAVPLPWLDDVARAKQPACLPTVLTQAEVQSMLEHTDGTAGMMLHLLYGTVMRLRESARLRVKDVDFAASDHRARRQGRQGLGNDAAAVCGNTAARTWRRSNPFTTPTSRRGMGRCGYRMLWR